MAAQVPSGAISALISALDGLQTARYTNAAATVIYLYNILLTFDLEVEHIWSRLSFNLPTILYMINRYVCFGCFLATTYSLAGFHGPFNEAQCRNPIDLVGFLLAHLSWTSIMTLRVCALWRQKQILVKVVWALWFATAIATIVTGYLAFHEVTATMTYNTTLHVCSPTSSPRVLAFAPIAPTVYELGLTALTLIKAFDFGASLTNTNTPILYRVLARDGVAFFLISAGISAGNMVAWLFLPPSQLYLLLYIYWAMVSTLVARLMLNLRATYCRSIADTTGISANVTFLPSNTSAPDPPPSMKGFINGEAYMGVDTILPASKYSQFEKDEDPWNLQVFNAAELERLPLPHTDPNAAHAY